MSGVLLRGTYGRTGLYSEAFPDPFQDQASLSMPPTMRSAMYWCEHIYSLFGTYAMAMERVVSYFITDIEFGDEISDDEEEKWSKFLRRTIDIKGLLQRLMRNRMAYGNAFASVI